MIKLTDLLNEQESFTATSKKSGETVVFKSKDARDSAVKAGTHSKIKDSDDGDSKKDTPKVNIFKRDSDRDSKERLKKKSTSNIPDNDYSYHDEPKKDKKSEPKSEPSKVDLDDVQYFTDLDDLIDKNKSKLSKQQIDKLTQLSADWEDAEGEMMMGGDEEADAEYYRVMSSIKDDIEDILSEPKSEPFNLTDDFIDSIKGQYKNVSSQTPEQEKALEKSLINKLDKEQLKKLANSDVNVVSDMAAKKLKGDEPKNESSTSLRDLLPESIIKEGTRSQVGVIGRNGKIVSAYVHYDGYPSNMKPGLKKHMKSDKDVLKLIKMGGARGIFDDKEIEYYKSGKPMKGDSKDVESYIKNADRNEGAEFVYLYNMKDKKWYYADTYKDSKLKKLF